MTPAEPIVGIDLGTTYSAVAILRGGQVDVLPNALGDALTPSVVAVDDRSGSLLVGRTAKDLLGADATRGAATFKRAMGTDLQYPIAGARYGAVELSAMVLKSLKADAERALGRAVTRAVVTVPAYFDEAQRFATQKAGELAGLDVVRILNEPTAAAIAHGLHRRTSDATLLVFDLGGGTFDVCVMSRFEGVLEVRSVAGESRLGGEDFTRRLAALALDRAGVPFERAELVDPVAVGMLVKRAELLKRRLTTAESGTIVVPALAGLRKDPLDVEITRAEADATWTSLVERLLGPCRAALRGASIRRDQIDELILVGGATRMPCVRRFVQDTFGREPLSGVDPDLAVVHGAAIQAALVAQEAAVGDVVVTDVASHSLGIDIARPIGADFEDGFFLPIIHRNSVIPTSQSTTVATLHANQTGMIVQVFEGESRYVKDNRKIGEIRVKGIPKGPPGREVEVRFTFDLNGILEVDVKVVDTGATISRVFHRESKHLSPPELEAARSRLDRIKQDPREAPAIRDVIGRAEALFQEVDPTRREMLSQALDALESALRDRDPRRIDESAAYLRTLCEGIDEGERW
jgi:molecular chaperone HscC